MVEYRLTAQVWASSLAAREVAAVAAAAKARRVTNERIFANECLVKRLAGRLSLNQSRSSE